MKTQHFLRWFRKNHFSLAASFAGGLLVPATLMLWADRTCDLASKGRIYRSKTFHCPRALWIAQRHGLNAIAFAAPDVSLKAWSLRAEARELLARVWCGVDLYVLHRRPKFPDPREPILISSILP